MLWESLNALTLPAVLKWNLVLTCFLFTFSFQQPYAPPPHPMAPPSPSTNSCSQGGAEQLSKTNLYIRGLPPGTTDQDLIKLCQPWVLGTIVIKYNGYTVILANSINISFIYIIVCRSWPRCACQAFIRTGVRYRYTYVSFDFFTICAIYENKTKTKHTPVQTGDFCLFYFVGVLQIKLSTHLLCP